MKRKGHEKTKPFSIFDPSTGSGQVCDFRFSIWDRTRSGAVGYCRIMTGNDAYDVLIMTKDDPQGVERRQNPVQKQGASRIIPDGPGWSRVSLISECGVRRAESKTGGRTARWDTPPYLGFPVFNLVSVLKGGKLSTCFRLFHVLPPLGHLFISDCGT